MWIAGVIITRRKATLPTPAEKRLARSVPGRAWKVNGGALPLPDFIFLGYAIRLFVRGECGGVVSTRMIFRSLSVQLAKGQMLGGVDGFLKLLFDTKSLKLLGVHAFGEGATEIIHIGQVRGSARCMRLFARACCEGAQLRHLVFSLHRTAARLVRVEQCYLVCRDILYGNRVCGWKCGVVPLGRGLADALAGFPEALLQQG